MFSTLVDRTMQSGYSELMGLFNPDPLTGNKLTKEQVDALTSGVAAPPMNIKYASDIGESLGDLPLPDGFTGMPIFNHMEEYNSLGEFIELIDDDLDLYGCGYVDTVDGYRFPAESTYTDYEYLKTDLRWPFYEAYGLSYTQAVNMSYMDLYGYCDIYQSDLFEGLPTYDYTDDDIVNIDKVVLTTLILPLADPVLSRNMYVSKQL